MEMDKRDMNTYKGIINELLALNKAIISFDINSDKYKACVQKLMTTKRVIREMDIKTRREHVSYYKDTVEKMLHDSEIKMFVREVMELRKMVDRLTNKNPDDDTRGGFKRKTPEPSEEDEDETEIENPIDTISLLNAESIESYKQRYDAKIKELEQKIVDLTKVNDEYKRIIDSVKSLF